jgi:TP901 family phage tail tape measure protein
MAIEAARLTVVVDAATDAAERGLDRIGDRVNGAGSMIRGAASTAFGFLAAEAAQGAARAAGSMFTLGVDTEAAMNMFASVSGATGDTMAQVSKLARDLGNDITLPGTSAKDATFAMLELTKAGLSVDQSMKAAQGTLQLAAAAGISAAEAGETAAAALNMFGLDGTQANRVADLLAGTANAAAGSMNDVAFALKMSGSVAQMAGVPIEDLTSAIGLMANNGILGSDAGTSLKTMLLSLTAPTDKAAFLMKHLGLETRDASGKLLPMRDLIANTGAALGKLSEGDRAAAMRDIFGTDAIRAANIVLAGGVEQFDALKGQSPRTGSAAEVANARMKGVGGAIEGLKSQVETVLIDAFNLAAPTMERVIRVISEGFPRALAVAGSALGTVAGAVRAMVGAFQAGGNDVTSSGMAGAFERIGLAARQVFDTVRDNWPQIRATVAQVMEGVRTAIGIVVGFVVEHWPEISRVIGEVMGTAREIIGTALEAIAAFWRTWGGTVMRLVEDAFNAVRQIIDGALNVIRGLIDFVMGLVRGDWSRVWDGLRDIVSGFWTVLNGIVDAALGALRTIIEVAMRLIAGVFDSVWERVKDATGAAWDGIKGAVSDAAGAVWDTISALPGRIGGLVFAFASAAAELGKGIVDGIVSGIKGVASGALDFAQAFGNAVIDVINEQIIDRINGLLEFTVPVPFGPDIKVDPRDVPHIPRFHTGGVVSGSGDVLAILKGGEAVFTPSQMRMLGQVIAGGRPSSSSNVVVNFNGPVNASRRTTDAISASVAVGVARTMAGRRLAVDARGAA